MAAGKYDIKCEQFASFSLPITWNDVNGNPVDLTNYTAKAVVADLQGNPVYEFSDANNTIALGGVLGTVLMQSTPVQLMVMVPGSYIYDLKLFSPTGVETRLLEGSFTFVAGVTGT